jgi:hypothetical protein
MKKSLLVRLTFLTLGLLTAFACGGCGPEPSPNTSGNKPGTSSPTKDQNPMHDNDAPK